ncbi:hypothetical protein [Sphingobacterium lactis]|uniref:hypothetical protein n=1 Tax=Sphingobacterium lactis TaxID=797291 RepID=UPI003DA658E1
MKSFGTLLIFYGVFAIILNFFDRVPRIMAWIYQWGEGTAWAIKIGFVVLGIILWIVGNRMGRTQAGKFQEGKPE